MQNKKEIKDFMLGQSFIKVVINMFSNIQVNGVNPMILAMAEDGIDLIEKKSKFFFVKYSTVDRTKFMLLVCEYR